jgi:hypothetical protein
MVPLVDVIQYVCYTKVYAYKKQMSIKKSKYNNIKTVYGGVRYDSKSEAAYAAILDKMLAEGKIAKIERQVKYPMPNRFGKMTLRYIADFVVTGNSGNVYILDVKGVLTPANNIKLAYVQHYHKIFVHLIFTTGLKKYDTSFLI